LAARATQPLTHDGAPAVRRRLHQRAACRSEQRGSRPRLSRRRTARCHCPPFLARHGIARRRGCVPPAPRPDASDACSSWARRIVLCGAAREALWGALTLPLSPPVQLLARPAASRARSSPSSTRRASSSSARRGSRLAATQKQRTASPSGVSA
jgi:hypothetical protein